MDEYLSEREQIDRMRTWWRENAWYLLGGVTLGLVALFGYGRYQDTISARAEAASVLYRQLESAANDDNLAEAERLLATLQEEYSGSVYTDQGSLMLAKLVLVRDTDRAAAELRRVMDNSDDPDLAMIARLRLARVLAYREQYAEALALLPSEGAGSFSARISEIRGDIFLAQGNRDAARAAFAESLVEQGSDLLDREFVQMKLSSLLVALETTPTVNPAAFEAADSAAEGAQAEPPGTSDAAIEEDAE